MNPPFQSHRIQPPPDHISNGGTFVTETGIHHDPACNRADIAQSVREFGDTAVYMTGTALHTTRKPADISDFWRFHEARIATQP